MASGNTPGFKTVLGRACKRNGTEGFIPAQVKLYQPLCNRIELNQRYLLRTTKMLFLPFPGDEAVGYKIGKAQGGMRMAMDCKLPEIHPGITLIGKFYMNTPEIRALGDDIAEREVNMQLFVKGLADKFNSLGVPKKVNVVTPYLAIMPEGLAWVIEPYLGDDSQWKKHNDNDGRVLTDRLTPQTFSHWTYQQTGGEALVCDMQGVEDWYTDPQVHSRRPGKYGGGDLGVEGMRKFRDSHRCNEICKFLKLSWSH